MPISSQPARSLPEVDQTIADQRLAVNRALADPAAFESIFDQYWPSVHQYCSFRISNPEDAEDAAIRVMTNGYSSLPRFGWDCSFPSWLFTIAHIEVANVDRSQSRTREQEIGETSGPSDPALSPELYRFEGPGQNNAEVPAVVPLAQSTPEAVGDLLLLASLDIPAELTQGAVGAGLDHIFMTDGITYNYAPQCCPGPWMQYLVDGQLQVSSSAPMRVFRAGGTEETISADTTVALLAGDAFIAENDVNQVAVNPGPEVTNLLTWVLLNDDRFSGHDSSGYDMSTTADIIGEMDINPGPAEIALFHIDSYDEIPAAGENQYVYVIQQSTNKLDQQDFKAPWQFAPNGTPTGSNTDPSYYVLVFTFSPTGESTAVAATPSP